MNVRLIAYVLFKKDLKNVKIIHFCREEDKRIRIKLLKIALKED